MKRTQKFAIFFVLMLFSVLFAVQASAATLDEYKAQNPQLDFSATEELTASQKNTFEAALAAATTETDAPYSTVVEQKLIDAFVTASKVIAYEGVQARLSEGADGIRSRYSVDREALAALEEYGAVSFGAIMGIAEMGGETGLNSTSNLKVFHDARLGWLASGYRTTAVVVYDKGVDTGRYTDGAAKSHFAYTTIYDNAYANGASYSGIGMVYRGFVAVSLDGTDYVLYVDGMGKNFGSETATYGAATTLSELAQYMVETYKEEGVRVYADNAKLRNVLWGVHNFGIVGDDGSRVCKDCGYVDKPALEAPSADVADFSVEVTDFAGKITVPAANITASGFYWVTLEGVTKITSGYKYLYNENGKLYASKNRDPGDGATYSVYLEAGKDNVLTYEGATLTKANFKLAEPTSADTIMMTSGKNDLTANTVTNAAFKDNIMYQMRAGSVLNYKKTVTVADGGFYTIGAAVCGNTTGTVTFTFTNAAGDAYTASFNCADTQAATGVTITASGSESFRYAADLTAIYLPAGEYSLTVSLAGGNVYKSIGVITMNPVDHVCRDPEPYNQSPTCTEKGLTGEGCPICLNGITVVPANGHSWDEGVYSKATCEVDGGTLYTCSVCSETKVENLEPAPGHTWDGGVETEKPGCTTPGVTTYTCTVCTTGVKTEPIEATGHNWGDWVENADGTAETRTCNTCHAPETRPISKDGKILNPTFTTTDNKTWTITVPADQIVKTGIYRLYFKTSGNWAKQYMRLESSSGNIATSNRFKDASVDADGYSMWWIETYIEKGDADVTLTFSFAGAQGDITEMKLSLLAEVVAVTKTKIGSENGSFASVAAGDYTVVAFFNVYNGGAVTVVVDGQSYTVGTASANGNFTGGNIHYDGSTGTAHYMNMGEISFAENATDVVVSTSGSGQNINVGSTAGASQKGYIPVFLVIPVTE